MYGQTVAHQGTHSPVDIQMYSRCFCLNGPSLFSSCSFPRQKSVQYFITEVHVWHRVSKSNIWILLFFIYIQALFDGFTRKHCFQNEIMSINGILFFLKKHLVKFSSSDKRGSVCVLSSARTHSRSPFSVCFTLTIVSHTAESGGLNIEGK